jgi:hypothetical protein
MLVLACLLSGCKSQREASPPLPATPAAGPEWQWPLNDARLSELRALPVQERNRVMQAMTPPTYQIHRGGPINADGVLAEPDWQRAEVVRMREIGHGTPPWYGTAVRMLYDEANLYVAFECDDPDVVSTFENHDDPLWKGDAVEVMIDPDSNPNSYMELMASPAGVLYDAVWADFRPRVDWVMQPTWERIDIESAVRAWGANEVKVGVVVDGTLNDSSDSDTGYVVEMVIPFAALREVRRWQPEGDMIDMTVAPLVPIAVPTAGTEWRMNLLRSNPSAPLLVEGEQSAWSPTGSSVHMPAAFGSVRFLSD